MLVSATRPVLLVRSVVYQPGWLAALTPLDGGSVRFPCRFERRGLLQAVQMPDGRYRVTWLYASRSLIVSGALTLGSIALFAALAALAIVHRRRRRRKVAPSALEGGSVVAAAMSSK